MAVHRARIRVRYGETDQMGVVHHSVYPLYFEEARTGLLRDLGRSYAALERAGTILPVVEMAISFRAPLRYEEEFLCEARVTEVTGVRVRFDYRITDVAGGRLVAEGHTTLASIDGEGKPRRLPADLAETLRGVREPGEPGRNAAAAGVQEA